MSFPKPKYKKKRKPTAFKYEGKPYCQVCGRTDNGLHKHHIELKGMGGSNKEEVHSQDNMITLCMTCHAKAHYLVRGESLSGEELREYKARGEQGLINLYKIIGAPVVEAP